MRKKRNREAPEEELLQERKSLVEKKISDGLKPKEKVRLRELNKELAKLEEKRYKSSIDALKKRTEEFEAFAKFLKDTLEELRRKFEEV